MKQKRYYSMIISLGLIILLVIIGQDYLWGSETKLSAKKGYLGVSVKRLTSSLKRELNVKEGVVVTWVQEDSPADKAGIMEDDVIFEVDGNKIKRPTTLSRVIRKIKPGTETKVVLFRDGKKESIKVKVGKLRRGYWRSFGDLEREIVMFKSAPHLGVFLHGLNDDLADYFSVKADAGALILEVDEDSPADEAGLKAGDVIIKVEDEDISEPVDVKEIISEFEDGDEITVEVIRHKKKISFKVVLEEDENEEHRVIIRGMPYLEHLKNLNIKIDDHINRKLERLKDRQIKWQRGYNNLSGAI